ncbi:hypothetical protein [Methylobacillus glycogenes]|uniref:hypothetical protein n=1 Tax=Methylobacillus glycogenes TaxID=406 RepID=UPI00046E9485|nr:hypothetical protein [Methylobacillus glycogenes]MBL8505998.1 hypothetical protein [Methylobacillus glycogenes]
MSEYSAVARRYVYSSFYLLLTGYLFPILALTLTDVMDNPELFFSSLGLTIVCTACSMGLNFVIDRHILDVKTLKKQNSSKFRQRFLDRNKSLFRIYQLTDLLCISNLLLCPVAFYYIAYFHGF